LSVTLIDTNVLLDLFTNDPVWAEWSVRQLDAAALKGRLAVNEMVYAELSVRFASIENLDETLDAMRIVKIPTPRSALFLAGKAFQTYRNAGGPRTGVLSDFFIGAHAATTGLELLTRDARRYRTYFPKITLVKP
jgi:predicted nucleic acid-binding protein